MKIIRLPYGRLPIGTFPKIIRALAHGESMLISHEGTKPTDLRRILYRAAKDIGAKVKTVTAPDGLVVSLTKKEGIGKMSRPVQGMRFTMQILNADLQLISEPETCEVVEVSLVDSKVMLIKVGSMVDLVLAHVTQDELAGFLHTTVITANDEDRMHYFLNAAAKLSNELEGYLWKVLD